ncbi:BgTH12-05261 [Blumeria graminis f. sp. triticale]|uniref:Bgt-3068 n=2 Tax=Blumeria graminis TaxID=34373 RepID=A0A9X9MHI5_BLUGR|nr:BgTH12-05261 [Blumeria graminis f. sp. triticale]VDB88104.1 Bgt-3068 [Blumeria graminis f. sp. tritici]
MRIVHLQIQSTLESFRFCHSAHGFVGRPVRFHPQTSQHIYPLNPMMRVTMLWMKS